MDKQEILELTRQNYQLTLSAYNSTNEKDSLKKERLFGMLIGFKSCLKLLETED